MNITATQALRTKYIAQTNKRQLYSGILILIFFVLLGSGFYTADDRNAGSFWDGISNIFDFPTEVLSEAEAKLALMPSNLVKFSGALIETVNIAAAATLLASICAIFLAFLSTRGLAKWPRMIPVFRRVMDILRAIPEIVIALVLIFILGGGPVPAMIAIWLHTVGALGKLFSEVIENADLKPVEGLESVGAGWLQRMWVGVLPQVAPNFLSYALLRFEINVRASAILGFVGAGGIGYELKNAISWGTGRYDEAAAIFVLLFLTIILFDQVSSYARNALIGSKK